MYNKIKSFVLLRCVVGVGVPDAAKGNDAYSLRVKKYKKKYVEHYYCSRGSCVKEVW